MGIPFKDSSDLRSFFLLALAAFAALSFGVSYGNVANQATYFVHALQALDPSLYPRDWLIQETTAYHSVFRWIILALAALGPLPWAAAVLNTLLLVVCLWLLVRMVQLLEPQAPGVTFLLTLVFIGFDQTMSVAGTYILGNGLQPSTLATVGWCAAMLAFLRDKPLHSGLLLAVSGIFHVNFLLLGIGMFGLAQLILMQRDWVRRIGAQVLPSVVMTAFFLPVILDAGSGEQAPLARTIFQSIRAPHHYLPTHYLFDFMYLGGWTIAGFCACAMLPERTQRRLATALLGSITLCVAGATLLTTLVFIPTIAQLFVWRIAPFGQLLAQLLIACALIGLIREPASLRHNRLSWIGIALSLLLILRWCLGMMPVTEPRLLIVAVTLLAVVASVLWQSRFQQHRVPATTTVVIGMLAIALLGVNMRDQMNRSTLVGPPTPITELSQWAQTTRSDALFLIPPALGEFRLLSQRSVVVDWKSTPVSAQQLLAWYARISDIVGRKVEGENDVVRGYRALDAAQLQQLARKYGAEYVVVETAHPARFPGQAVYRNQGYSVYAVLAE